MRNPHAPMLTVVLKKNRVVCGKEPKITVIFTQAAKLGDRRLSEILCRLFASEIVQMAINRAIRHPCAQPGDRRLPLHFLSPFRCLSRPIWQARVAVVRQQCTILKPLKKFPYFFFYIFSILSEKYAGYTSEKVDPRTFPIGPWSDL